MAKIDEGNGVTYTYAGINLPGPTLEIPGFSREAIDVTNLTNTTVMTQVLATLAKYNDFILNVEFDPAEYAALLAAGNGAFVITFKDNSAITVYANIASVDNTPMENGTRALYSITFAVTNLNAGVETAPAYAAGA